MSWKGSNPGQAQGFLVIRQAELQRTLKYIRLFRKYCLIFL